MHVFGIDLGTTNSAMSVYIGNETSKIIELDNGKTTMPSCILIKDEDTIIVGEEAYNNRHLPNVIYSAKRFMGTDKVFKIKTHNADGEDVVVEFKPEEVGAEVIKELVKRASYLYPEIKDVTITVPAEFNNLQREATQRAGELAGLNVIAIINEPTSAGLAYETKKTKNILAYDLGGGTFDVSVITVTVPEELGVDSESAGLNFADLGINLGGPAVETTEARPSYRILANKGDVHLGGDDIDQGLVTTLLGRLNQIQRQKGKYCKLHKDLPSSVIEKLKLDVESVKKSICASGYELGSAEFVVDATSLGMGKLSVTADYGDFVEATLPIYRRTKLLTNGALVESGLSWSDISEIILVGGSTKSAIIYKLLQTDFPDRRLNNSINPDECVAIGASKQTAISKGIAQTMVTDVVPQTISVETIRLEIDDTQVPGSLSPLIMKNTPLPVSVIRNYSVDASSNKTNVRIYQGNGSFINEALKIGELVIEKEESTDSVVTVMCTINVNGVLEVKVKQDGKFVSKKLSNVFGLNVQEVKKTPRDKICAKLERSLNRVYKRVPKQYKEALEDYRLTGNAESKKLITDIIESKLPKLSDADIMVKTSVFEEGKPEEANTKNEEEIEEDLE